MNALTPRSSTRLSHASCWLSSHSGIPGVQELSNRPLELPLAFIENFHSSHRKKRNYYELTWIRKISAYVSAYHVQSSFLHVVKEGDVRYAGPGVLTEEEDGRPPELDMVFT